MVDTALIMQAARQPDVNLPDILQRSAESAAAIENLPLRREAMQIQNQQGQLMNQQRQGSIQEDERAGAVRKAGLIYNYVNQLQSLPMEQRRTFIATIPQETLQDIGFDPKTIGSLAIDDASLATTAAQLEPIVQQGKQQQTARRSESLAGGRITAQELSDGTVRYLEYGQEIPADQVRERVTAANQEFAQEQQALSTSRRGGALDAELERKPLIAEAETRAKKQATGEEGRAQTIIDAGVDASYQLPTIRRTIDLLDEVKTGGFNKTALRVKQAFGIEGADEGELSANLGKAVLSQLRDTFGAAFTENEGKRLERIEANFGKNAETNKRLLGNMLELAEKKVDTAISRAEARGDMETVDELRSNLSYRMGTTNQEDVPQAQAAQAQTPQEAPKRLRFNAETGLLE